MALFKKDEVPKLLAEAGYYALKTGEYARAHLIIQVLQAYRPDDRVSTLLRGLFQFAVGQFAEAERTYRTFLEQHPDDLIEAHLAEALIAQKRWGDAERHLQHIIESSHDDHAKNFARELYEGLRVGVFQKG